jgi:hypothetical protein
MPLSELCSTYKINWENQIRNREGQHYKDVDKVVKLFNDKYRTKRKGLRGVELMQRKH